MSENSFGEIAKSIIPTQGTTSVQGNGDSAKWTEEQYLRWQVANYNSIAKAPSGDYNCPACKNRGFFACIDSAGNFALRPCTCNGIKLQMANAKKSGLGDMINQYTFESYEVNDEWQYKVKEGALIYTQQTELPWLYIGGMSGAGKSHICTAAATRILQRGKAVKYVLWRDILRKLESARFDEYKYSEFLQELTDIEVLVIDDFLKGMDKSKQASAVEAAYDVINRRYNGKNKPTIISSEFQITELESLDRALAGRIRERCGKFMLNIKNDGTRNYRKRKG